MTTKEVLASQTPKPGIEPIPGEPKKKRDNGAPSIEPVWYPPLPGKPPPSLPDSDP